MEEESYIKWITLKGGRRIPIRVGQGKKRKHYKIN